MQIPELRTVKHMISPNKFYTKFHEAVADEKGNVVGVFFGPYAGLLAEYTTSWTDVMKLARAQVRDEDRKFDFQGGNVPSVVPLGEEVMPLVEPQPVVPK